MKNKQKPAIKQFKDIFFPILTGIAIMAVGFISAARSAPVQSPHSPQDTRQPSPAAEELLIMEGQDLQPIAKVGETIIPGWMYDNAMNDRLGKGWENRALSVQEITNTRMEIIDNLVTMALLEAEAEKAGITLSIGAGALRSKIVEGSFKNRRAFLDALAQAGMTEAQYRTIWQQQAVVNELIRTTIEAKVEIDETEIQALYRQRRPGLKQPPQIRARHILIKADKKTSPEERTKAEKKALEILEKLKQGGDFAELAEKHSSCVSGKKGGDLGWFAKGKMAPAFSQAALALENNEISDVVKTRFGYHIIQKTGYRPESLAAYDDVKAALHDELVKQKTRETLNEYIIALKKAVKIEIYK